MSDIRVRDVSAMTDSELERAGRHLMVSLSLAFPANWGQRTAQAPQ